MEEVDTSGKPSVLFRRDSSDGVNDSFPDAVLFDPYVRRRFVGDGSQGLAGFVLFAGNISEISYDRHVSLSIYADAMIVLFNGGRLPSSGTQLSGNLGLGEDAGIGILVCQIIGIVAIKPVRSRRTAIDQQRDLVFFNFGDFFDSLLVPSGFIRRGLLGIHRTSH